MEIRPMLPGEEQLAIDIVARVFDAFVAPGYSEQGCQEFYRYADAGVLKDRSRTNHFTLIAREGNEAVGLIEIRDNCHIAMFFVLKAYQRKGVGRALLNEAVDRVLKEKRDLNELSVNSSPNAVSAYERMGFIAVSAEKCIKGIRFVPMRLKLHRREGSVSG